MTCSFINPYRLQFDVGKLINSFDEKAVELNISYIKLEEDRDLHHGLSFTTYIVGLPFKRFSIFLFKTVKRFIVSINSTSWVSL